MPLYREDLEPMSCDVPGCTAPHGGSIYLHSKCHPHAPMWAAYRGGRLRIECSRCQAEVLTVIVARRSREASTEGGTHGS